MSEGSRQFVLELPLRTALGAEDFLVSPVNAAAVDLIDRWPKWPSPIAMICGAPGVGKTHLVTVWQSRSSAARVSYPDVDETSVQLFQADGVIAIEDVDRGGGDERSLFHILNLARENRGTVLLTAACRAGELDIRLPDLRSRLRAAASVVIAAPDDTLLHGLLIKLFSDRQLLVEPQVVSYLVRHMERSADAARRLVIALDNAALADRKRVTKVLAGRVLADLFGSDEASD